MENNEELIELHNGCFISKKDYQKAVKEFMKKHKGDAPLTFEGREIGVVSLNENGKMVVEITTEKGKEIIEGVLYSPISISSRKKV